MTWLIGVWCLTAAGVIGWLLWRLHRADRHPATRAERIGRVVVPGRVCATCTAPVVGPMIEHICGGPR